jgi:hypothetical protein
MKDRVGWWWFNAQTDLMLFGIGAMSLVFPRKVRDDEV